MERVGQCLFYKHYRKFLQTYPSPQSGYTFHHTSNASPISILQGTVSGEMDYSSDFEYVVLESTIDHLSSAMMSRKKARAHIHESRLFRAEREVLSLDHPNAVQKY